MASPFSANAVSAFLSRYYARELRTVLDVPVLETDFESRMQAAAGRGRNGCRKKRSSTCTSASYNQGHMECDRSWYSVKLCDVWMIVAPNESPATSQSLGALKFFFGKKRSLLREFISVFLNAHCSLQPKSASVTVTRHVCISWIATDSLWLKVCDTCLSVTTEKV
jgi:hypothetical protein